MWRTAGPALCLASSPTRHGLQTSGRHLVEQLLAIFEKEPDPGLHAACRVALAEKGWNCDDRLQAAIERLAS